MDVWDNISIYFSFDFYSGKKFTASASKKEDKIQWSCCVDTEKRGFVCYAVARNAAAD